MKISNLLSQLNENFQAACNYQNWIKMTTVTMYRLRISKRLPGGKYEHRYSKEYQSVQQLFAQPAFADYLQKNVAGNVYMSLHIEKRNVVVEEEGGAK